MMSCDRRLVEGIFIGGNRLGKVGRREKGDWPMGTGMAERGGEGDRKTQRETDREGNKDRA